MNNFQGNNFVRVEASSFSKTCFEILETFAQALVVTIIVFAVFFRTATVSGDSMFPTLHNNDKLYIWKYKYVPKRGDIVPIIKGQNINKNIIKRIIAVEGDMLDVQFDSDSIGQVFVNGEALDEPYINGTMHRFGMEVEYPQVIPKGYLAVFGDNRDHSSDSRFDEVGLVKVEDVVGKAVWIFFPPYRFGAVK